MPMYNLASKILTTPWMIHSASVEAMLPQIVSILNGTAVNFPNQVKSKSYLVPSSSISGSVVEGKVAVVEIKGVIMKADQNCGPLGTQSINAVIKNYANDSSVSAIVLDLDTPGGQASFLETLGNTLQSIEKPVLAYYSGLCASAGYHIASNSAEIYASEPTDIVGSIGTMISLVDSTEALKQKGYSLHEIYATQSEHKNKIFKDALSGNYTEIQKQLLDPIAQSFIDRVKSNREITSEEVFKGGTYMSAEAQKLGLIDGVKTLDQVIARALELSEPTTANHQKTNMKNKFTTVESVLGFEKDSLQAKDGHVSLSVEDLETVNSSLENSQEANKVLAVEKNDLTTNLATATASVKDLEEKLTASEASNQALIAENVKLGKTPSSGKETVKGSSNEFDDVEHEAWNDPNDQFNRKARIDLGLED